MAAPTTMIFGQINSNDEAVMRLILKGTNGVEVDIEAIIDTGFTNYLSLPQTWVDALALTRLDAADVTLAYGAAIQVSIFEGVVVWDGQDRLIEIHCLEGSPLVGMSMLYDYHLSFLSVTAALSPFHRFPKDFRTNKNLTVSAEFIQVITGIR